MTARYLALVVVLLFPGSQGVASAASPAPGANVAPDPCASSVPDLPNDLETAFAYELQPAPILHFITVLANVPQHEQKRVFDAAVSAASTQPEQEAESAVAAACPNLDEIYGASRASYLVVNEWTLKQLSDPKRFQDFSAVVATAISAMSLGDRLTPGERATALLPFAGIIVPASPLPSPPASGPCAQPHIKARIVHIVQPAYPPLAVAAATSGTVRVKLSLSDTGDVRSARLFSDTLGNALGSQEIVRAVVFAAAASTYAPEVSECVSVSGRYFYRADYRRS